MGFPVGYSELPNCLLQALFLLGYVRRLIYGVFNAVGLGDLLEPDLPWAAPEAQADVHELRSESLPVVLFAELGRDEDSCAVCLHEFAGEEEVRRLRNCCHIFHRCCLDPWMDHGQRTCPLCRAPLFADEAPSVTSDDFPADFFADYSSTLLISDQLLSS